MKNQNPFFDNLSQEKKMSKMCTTCIDSGTVPSKETGFEPCPECKPDTNRTSEEEKTK